MSPMRSRRPSGRRSCGIVPFIIDDRHKLFYYRGLKEWDKMPGYLRDTCLLMQDDFKALLEYFGIEYEK